jgi:hypothetical protein
MHARPGLALLANWSLTTLWRLGSAYCRCHPPLVRRPAGAPVYLACLPMNDLEESGAIVNASERHADAIVQKEPARLFGLTVTEAM